MERNKKKKAGQDDPGIPQVSDAKESTPLEEIIQKIAHEAPGLKDLNEEQLQAVAQMVVGQKLVKEMDRLANLANINWYEEMRIFLLQSGAIKSAHTYRAYQYALGRLDAWLRKKNISPLELSPRLADDLILSMVAEGRAPASVHRDVAGMSSFYNFLARRYDAVTNPFRGTRGRPRKDIIRKIEVPSYDEVGIILEELQPDIRAAAIIMLYRGLRVGALPPMVIKDNRFSTVTKGKKQNGELPAIALEALAQSGLHPERPFKGFKATQIADRIRWTTKRLQYQRKIEHRYSVHDFRHYYAITHYQEHKDIYLLSRILGHAGIQVTETYLRGLGLID